MAAVQHNAYAVAERLIGRGPAVEREIALTLDRLAQDVARVMRRQAPHAFGTLAESVQVSSPAPMQREIKPGAAYAGWRERGTPPGTMPPPDALTGWIRLHLNKGFKRSRSGRSFEQEVRDRAWGLAMHIKRFGTKANPFVERTANEMAPLVASQIALAIRRGLAAQGSGNAGASA